MGLTNTLPGDSSFHKHSAHSSRHDSQEGSHNVDLYHKQQITDAITDVVINIK